MNNDNKYFETERHRLVNLLKKKGIKSKDVLDAISGVKREMFVADDMLDKAYIDNALPIEEGQTISQPFTVAYMTEILEVYSGCKVLEIGTGSGYQTAILSCLHCEVYTIERIELLYKKAKGLFEQIGINAKTFFGDGSLGLPEFAPYDRIIVTAAAPEIPLSLINQLNIGGRIVVPVGSKTEQTMTVVIRQSESKYDIERKEAFRFVPLIGKEGWLDE